MKRVNKKASKKSIPKKKERRLVEYTSVASLEKDLSYVHNDFKYWCHQKETLDQVIVKSVGGTTLRAFRCRRDKSGNILKRPSVVFRSWAEERIDRKAGIPKGIQLDSQESFDKWNEELCDSLREYWRKEMHKDLDYGPSRKMPDLLLKRLLKWGQLDKNAYGAILKYLHIPWDSRTLAAIRQCIKTLDVERSATMKFVDSKEKYDVLQEYMRQISFKADVPPICFDYLIWDHKKTPKPKSKGKN